MKSKYGQGEGMEAEVIRLAETDSTNNYLRECMERGRLGEGSVVIAERQTAGRGQAGNSWESEGGVNLTFSIMFEPCFLSAGQSFALAQLASLAIKETLDDYTPDIRIKWPNDIYWQDRKVGGILIENTMSGGQILSSIIGIGLNVNQRVFSAGAPNAVSLREIMGRALDREELFGRLLVAIKGRYRRLASAADFGLEYRRALYRGEGFHLWRDGQGTFEACIDEVEDSGHLRLRLRDGQTRRYAFKEVACADRS